MKIALCDVNGDRMAVSRQTIDYFAGKYNLPVEVKEHRSLGGLFHDYTDNVWCADLIIMDIRAERGAAFDEARRLRKAGYKNEILIVSDSEEKHDILSGYDIDAINYIIKDKTPGEKIEAVLSKAALRASARNVELLSLSCAGENRTVSISDIKYFEVEHRVVTVYYGKNESFSFYTPLEQIESALAGKGFVRNYRSQVVSVRRIGTYTFERIVLDDGTELPVSRSHSKDVREAVKRYSLK